METLIITSEQDIRRCIREVIQDEMKTLLAQTVVRGPAYDEPLLTRKETARYLNISLVTLTDWVRSGLPCIRKGRRVLFLKSEVLAAMKGITRKRELPVVDKKLSTSKLLR